MIVILDCDDNCNDNNYNDDSNYCYDNNNDGNNDF